MTKSARHWCYTINNYTNDDKQALADKATELLESGTIVYLVYGEEVGDSGTPHLQGFVSYAKRATMGGVKKLVGRRAHLEVARGTPSQASEYCKKDGAYTEFGRCPAGAGARSDLTELWTWITEGKSEEEIANAFPGQFLRYQNSIVRSIRKYQPERDWMPDNYILWGRAGTGKTRFVYDNHDRKDIYVHPGDCWFDGYEGQEVALFDDFHGGEFKLSYLLKLLDRYPMKVPVKGGFVQWKPRIIYLTSNKDPATWYRNALEEHQAALFRRIKETRYYE